jgi:hypothetical protein
MYKFEQVAIILPLPMSEQSAGSGSVEDGASDLLDPYEKLINLEIMGSSVSVPEKNRLLRCFQFLSMNTISYGDFCWNGECTNCQIWYHLKGQNELSDRPALSCRLECEEGMVITKLSRFIELEGITK